MFERSDSPSASPVDAETRGWIDARWQWLAEQFGTARLYRCPVVLPSPEFFPDPFDGSQEDARLLLDRVCGYMDIPPHSVELSFLDDNNPVHQEGAAQRTAGLYQAAGDKSRIWIEVGNLTDPLALVAIMAHELGHVHLLGTGRIADDAEDHEPLTDLFTVFVGLGVITANAVIREKNLRYGRYYAWSVSRVGYLTMPAYGYALAKFAQARGEQQPEWAKDLRPDMQAEFAAATRLLTAGVSPAVERQPELAMDEEDGEAESREPDRGELADKEFAEAPPDRRALTVDELRRRYASGDRDFRDISVCGQSLRGLDLSGSALNGTDLSGADLTQAVLADCDLRLADLQEAVLCEANLRRADLRDADLSGADLARADLTGADIRSADFSEGNLGGADLTQTLRNHRTDFRGVALATVLCDVDLSQEDRRPTAERLVGKAGRASAYAFLGFVAGMFIGQFAGNLITGGQRNDLAFHCVLAGGICGGILLGMIGFRHPRRQPPNSP